MGISRSLLAFVLVGCCLVAVCLGCQLTYPDLTVWSTEPQEIHPCDGPNSQCSFSYKGTPTSLYVVSKEPYTNFILNVHHKNGNVENISATGSGSVDLTGEKSLPLVIIIVPYDSGSSVSDTFSPALMFDQTTCSSVCSCKDAASFLDVSCVLVFVLVTLASVLLL